MSTKDDLKQSLISEFATHLNIGFNRRVIMSGRFGSGKTTFIRDFFEQHQATYRVIHLFPVNYSVASNEDIFKYLKYDIIFEMLKGDFNFISEDFEFLETLPLYLRSNLDKVAASLIYMIPVVGKDIADSYEKLNTVLHEMLNHHEKFKEDANELTAIKKFMLDIEMIEGGVYENGIINKIIESALGRKLPSASHDKEKEDILIIDDLDRLDPDHIFRLLNVFAAHFDDKDSGLDNRFGFEKVIFVCDIDNIRSIFSHRYGIDVDFNGYIDKFYTHEVFTFDSRKLLQEILYDILSKRLHRNGVVTRMFYSIKENGFISWALESFLEQRKINFRNILKFDEIDFNLVPMHNLFDLNVDIVSFPIIVQLDILQSFFGSRKALISAFKNLNEQRVEISRTQLKQYTEEAIYLLTANQHRFQNSEEFAILEQLGSYKLHRIHRNNFEKLKIEFEESTVEDFYTVKLLFTLLIDLIKLK